jgi:hypothetical protein
VVDENDTPKELTIHYRDRKAKKWQDIVGK